MKARIVGLLVCAGIAIAGSARAADPAAAPAPALRAQAEAAYARGDAAGALSAYQQLVGHGAGDAQTWTRIGNLEWLQDAPAAATAAFEMAVRLDPKATEAWHNLAIIRMRQAQAMLAAERTSLPPGSARTAAIACEQTLLASMLHEEGSGTAECTR
ncbi:MAG: hypothetical protein JSR26_11105 [Proteobacteria bacterium]|nr:hypothetical protein [Pseudomonadota bacterium]